MAQIQGILFDAYGTLFDVHSVVEAGRALTDDPQTLSLTWRQKQLEYTWLRALMGRYEDFWQVTQAALRYALRRLGLRASEAEFARLMEAYLSLRAFPEAKAALERLRGTPLAILSNGSPRMLAAAAASSGLAGVFAHVLSVDAVKTYKPSPKVYELGVQAMGAPAGQLLFVSANAWDVAGAKAFGYQVCWCNRANAPMEELGVAPDVTVGGLDEIPALVRRASAGSA
ncbi:MAG: haloacid dehalogenase type II [Candidatus Rokubacteria bacterium]|nr:haloacid dehalogenase type II [Candidatus Rokubacteria bacterium]